MSSKLCTREYQVIAASEPNTVPATAEIVGDANSLATAIFLAGQVRQKGQDIARRKPRTESSIKDQPRRRVKQIIAWKQRNDTRRKCSNEKGACSKERTLLFAGYSHGKPIRRWLLIFHAERIWTPFRSTLSAACTRCSGRRHSASPDT